MAVSHLSFWNFKLNKSFSTQLKHSICGSRYYLSQFCINSNHMYFTFGNNFIILLKIDQSVTSLCLLSFSPIPVLGFAVVIGEKAVTVPAWFIKLSLCLTLQHVWCHTNSCLENCIRIHEFGLGFWLPVRLVFPEQIIQSGCISFPVYFHLIYVLGEGEQLLWCA